MGPNFNTFLFSFSIVDLWTEARNGLVLNYRSSSFRKQIKIYSHNFSLSIFVFDEYVMIALYLHEFQIHTTSEA